MKKLIIVLFTLFFLILIFLIQINYANAQTHSRGIMSRLNNLELRVETLEDTVEELQEQIDELSWVSIFDINYWRAATLDDDLGGGAGSWNIDRWESGVGEWYVDFPYQYCDLIAVGTWGEGYRPTRVRITIDPPTSASTYIFAMFDSNHNLIAQSPWHCNGNGCYDDGFVSGQEFEIAWNDTDILFLGVTNLYTWTVVEDSDGNPYWEVVPAEPFAIINIEFLE